MKKHLKTIIIVLSFGILGLLIVAGHEAKQARIEEFSLRNQTVAGYAETTPTRIAQAVITLPNGGMIVGLNNNIGEYTSEIGAQGEVRIDPSHLKTNFIEGIYQSTQPRLDAVVPMTIATGYSESGSTYIVLFHDRGDATLEKSHARLGDKTVVIDSISMIPADANIAGQEYKVDIRYKTRNGATPKEVIIPVIDGRFDPERTVTQ